MTTKTPNPNCFVAGNRWLVEVVDQEYQSQ